jgi:hypothetical protein
LLLITVMTPGEEEKEKKRGRKLVGEEKKSKWG